MGALEEQARFLTAKYGTAAGPVGLPREAASTGDIAAIMIILGLVILAGILFMLLRDYTALQEARRVRSDNFQ